MSKHSESQQFDNAILRQRIELIFSRAESWETCTMPLTTQEITAKVMEEQGPFFEDEALIILILEGMNYKYVINEFNHKGYWLVNPA